MKTLFLVLFTLFISFNSYGCSQKALFNKTENNLTTQNFENMNTNNRTTDTTNYNKLTPQEERVILQKGTEMPYTGEYTDNKAEGTYICRRCNAPLYLSKDKFDSHCGWPSFDDEIKGAVTRIPDADGMRTEIICNNCGAHLGHVFLGEGFTQKDTRHCVNSISMKFVPASEKLPETISKNAAATKDEYQTAIFASGCFWGTEYYMQRAKGVISTEVGYIGGWKENPTYKEVCSGNTGHAEAIKIVYDPKQISYEELAKLFFETHDPTQINRQGPDIGEQYRTEVFYNDDSQKETTEKLIKQLQDKGYNVATKVTKSGTFWKAEDYHQDYYNNTGGTPYCHFYKKKFD